MLPDEQVGRYLRTVEEKHSCWSRRGSLSLSVGKNKLWTIIKFDSPDFEDWLESL